MLLKNLFSYARSYKPVVRPAILAGAPNSQLSKTVDATGVTHATSTDPIEAISQPGEKIAIIEATPENPRQALGES